ncbi:MAG TPA: 6-pyruvoyl-tetrahydropterin synthase-related protein [Candidatus Acidoferrum sp.]|nr:6-pyruvoyl-tetrahydropterin synthase-related protein [Candidatus Acidoferrum sp.]
MIFLGNVSGHDFRFHVESWMDVAGQWREGILFPRWAEWANWGFGEPRFVFYPPLSWLAGAAIGSVLPWRMAPGVFIWLALVVAGMSMWRLAKDWLFRPYATIAAVLYAVNPYHLVIVYYRSAFGELLAAALLPLLIWSVLRVTSGEWRRIPLLALVLASVWLSNAPAAVIATYSLALVIVIGCFRKRSFRPFVPGASAMIAGLALAAFYVAPAAWEQKWIQISQAVSDDLRPSANFLFTRANDPDFVAFNWKVSWVAVGLIVLTAIAVLSTWRKRREINTAWWSLSMLAAFSITLMLPVSLALWRLLPRLWFVQFPWRWLDVLDLSFALFVALAIANLPSRTAAWTVATALFVAIGLAGAFMARNANWDSSDVANIAQAIESSRGYEGADEYAPVGCDRYQLPGNPDDEERPADVSPNPAPRIAKVDLESDDVVPAAGVRLHTQAWNSERKAFTAESADAVTLAVRLVSYPAWKVEVNGRDTEFNSRATTQQILLPLRGGSNRVEIRFRRSLDRTLGGAISALSAAALCALAWVSRRRKNRTAA